MSTAPPRQLRFPRFVLTGGQTERDDAPPARGRRGEAWLEECREGLGESIWADRLAEAKEREAIVLRAQALIRQGHLPRKAAQEVAETAERHPATVLRWLERYEAEGLRALVDRRGHLRARQPQRHMPGGPPLRLKRRTKQALSFVKWVGSKRSVMHHILGAAPERYGTYFEPMVGSGTVFLSLKPKQAVIGDTNAELINCYEVIRADVDALIDALMQHENTEAHYLRVRAQDPAQLAPIPRAARTIYLNKTCFNGLYRVNAKGRFNVPFGWIAHAHIADEEALRRVSAQLQHATIRCAHYRETIAAAQAGDLVYFDPPYLREGRHDQTFGAYQAVAFGRPEHDALAATFRELAQRGCHVMLSNTDSPLVRSLYRGFRIQVLATRRAVNANAAGRRGWTELLIDNG